MISLRKFRTNCKIVLSPMVMKKVFLSWRSVLDPGSFGLAHHTAWFPQLRGQALAVLAQYGHPADDQPARLSKLLDLMPTVHPENRSNARPALSLQAIRWSHMSLRRSSGMWPFAARYDNGFYAKLPSDRTVNTPSLTLRTLSPLSASARSGGRSPVGGCAATRPFALKPGAEST
jgi:hypothetical protein